MPMPSAGEKKGAPVLAIAATAAIVIVGGGVGGYMMLSGGGEPAVTQEDPGQPGVTPGTEAQPPAGDPGTAQQQPATQQTNPPGGQTQPGGEQPGGRQPERQPDPEPEPPAGPDLGAIDRQLNAFSEATAEDTATEDDRAAVEAIYRNGEVPESVRSQAAFLIGAWVLFNGEMSDACLWYRRALDRDPTNSSAQNAYNSACQ